MYIVELENGVWIADTDGDPGRTLVLDNTQIFGTRQAAAAALKDARFYRPFVYAEIKEAP